MFARPMMLIAISCASLFVAFNQATAQEFDAYNDKAIRFRVGVMLTGGDGVCIDGSMILIESASLRHLVSKGNATVDLMTWGAIPKAGRIRLGARCIKASGSPPALILEYKTQLFKVVVAHADLVRANKSQIEEVSKTAYDKFDTVAELKLYRRFERKYPVTAQKNFAAGNATAQLKENGKISIAIHVNPGSQPSSYRAIALLLDADGEVLWNSGSLRLTVPARAEATAAESVAAQMLHVPADAMKWGHSLMLVAEHGSRLGSTPEFSRKILKTVVKSGRSYTTLHDSPVVHAATRNIYTQ